MSIGILLVCHDRIGQAMLEAAGGVLGVLPEGTDAVSVTEDADPDRLYEALASECNELDTGAGVLVLTDTYGSTPSNVCCRLFGKRNVRVIAGVNLPMLIRIFNYVDSSDDLDALAEKAVGGGRAGIIVCRPEDTQ